MTQTTLYASVLAKMGAERSKIPSETKIKTLTESKNLTELTTQLRDTSYQQQIAKLPPPLTSRKLERAFTENLIETLIKIVKNSPESVIAFAFFAVSAGAFANRWSSSSVYCYDCSSANYHRWTIR